MFKGMTMDPQNEAASPRVSIIVPCRNEEEHISLCLDSLLLFDYPKDRVEVIIVDGMSEDGTRRIAEGYVQRYDFLKMLDNPNYIVPSAMNIGIRASCGDIIVRMDAHAEYKPSYLRQCVDLLLSSGAGGAGGRFVTMPNGNGCWAVPVMRVTSHPFGVGNGTFRVGKRASFVDTVPYGTYKRKIFDDVGFFDERLTRNQDNEFNARLIKKGYRIAFDPEIKVFYKNQPNLRGLLQQAFYTGMWNVYTFCLHSYTFKWRRFIPFLFVVYLFLLVATSVFFPGFLATAYVIPFGVYVVAVFSFSFFSGDTLKCKLLTSVTFVCYHLTYGFGTCWGFINFFLGTWKKYLGRVLKK